MGGLISIRVSEKLQQQMRKYKINWSERMRDYLEAQIKQLELMAFLEGAVIKMKHSKLHADSARMIREDRESR